MVMMSLTNPILKLDTRVPALHLELAVAKILPKSCNLDQCLQKMELTYENCIGMG